MSDKLLSLALAAAGDRVVLTDGDRAWRGADVLDQVGNLAGQLASVRVLAVLADNSPAWVLADLACLKAGKVHLPLPAFFTPAQLRHALELSGADGVLTDQAERIEALDLGFVRQGTWQGLVRLERNRVPVALPANTAKISFTSGSTGAPKGVCLTAEGLLATAQALVERLSDLPMDRHLAVLPLALLLENVAGVYAPLLRGMAVHLPPLASLGWRGMAGFDPGCLQQAVQKAGAHSLILVPELLKAWSLFLAASGQTAPTGLGFVAVGGARCDPGLLLEARSRGLPAHEGYGLTECGSVICLNRPGADRPGSVGWPLSHVALTVDATGEILVDTPAFAGYLGLDDADSPSPASLRGRRFATGDLGHLAADGSLSLMGRRKNLIVTGYGRNVAPEWVESLLTAQSGVAQALVLGEARPWLAALLVPGPGMAEADLGEVVARANAALPDYARIGAWLSVAPFSPLDGLATGNGRPIRAAIAARYAEALDALYRPAATSLTPTLSPGEIPCPSTNA